MSAVNPSNQAFYGGRMTEGRLLAVRNATTEAIDHLHHSLESCPTTDTEAQDPKGLKVTDITTWKLIGVNVIIYSYITQGM